MRSPGFDNNSRRKKILIKFTMWVLLAYAITQIATITAYMAGISSVRIPEIMFVSAVTLSSALLFRAVIQIKDVISARFANIVFFGQFGIWLIMYPIWFLSLREVRSMALFCAFMALSFLLSHVKLWQAILVTALTAIIQVCGSYYAIVHLNQTGSLKVEIFYTLCFLPSALFMCNLSRQYSLQRSEVAEGKRAAEQSRDALQAETEKAYQLNANLQEALKTIQEISIRDVLTGLLNRRHLLEKLELEKKRAERTERMFSVVILDIDYFKKINDTLGHLQGDEVLKTVARAIQASLRDTDFCARYGGEEFVMVLEHCGENGALFYAERTRRLIELEKFPLLGEDFKVTVSMGVAQYRPMEEISQTLSRADQALYRAKDAGRNRVEEAT